MSSNGVPSSSSHPNKIRFSQAMDESELRSSVAASPNGTHLVHLRSNLMREQHDRDPLYYYEIVSVLGVGSMGSVAKVRKRDDAIGGTARKELVADLQRERVRKECWKLPLIGDCLRHCYEGADSDQSKPDAPRHRRGNSLLGLRTSVLLEEVRRPLNRGVSNYEVFYAMKSIHLNRVTDPEFIEELKNEIEILRQLDHPHIVRAIETFENRNQVFIVMELCSGGDLYSRDPYTEDEAARIVHAILSAISYMHSMKIAHRDLKYENVLFVSREPSASVKLIDFGLSKAYGSNNCNDLTEGVGTIYSMAPEVLTGKYTKQADMWSVGVLAFMLLSSQMPFYGRKRQHIVELILKGQYEFRGRRWKRVSPQSKEFVQELLVLDPNERPTAHDAMASTWLHRRLNSALTLRDALADEEEKIQQSIVRYAGYSLLKKMALNVVAHKSTSEEIGILRKVFEKYAVDGDGVIDFAEFAVAMESTGISRSHLKKIYDGVDLDGAGIRYTEFVAATIESFGGLSEERLAEAFDRLDNDDTGYISASDLREILGADFPLVEINRIMKEASLSNPNRISYPEFLALWDLNQDVSLRRFVSRGSDITDSNRTNSVRNFLLREHEATESNTTAASDEDRQELMRDNDEESTELSKINFQQGKQLSERRFEAAEAIVTDESVARKVFYGEDFALASVQ